MKPQSRHKYHNQTVIVDNIRFASLAESRRYQELKLLKQAGEIKDFILQPLFVLQEPYRKCPKCRNIQDHIKDSQRKKDIFCHKCGTRTIVYASIDYYADFLVIHNDGTETIEDVKGTKGYKTKEFSIKSRLFELKYPDKTIEIVVMRKRR